MNPNEKIIDWELATKLTNGNRALAEELLALLIKNLKQDQLMIERAYTQKDYPALSQHLHKLYGALCYCGTPRLKNAVALFQQSLKQKQLTELPKLYATFEQEITELLATSSQL